MCTSDMQQSAVALRIQGAMLAVVAEFQLVAALATFDLARARARYCIVTQKHKASEKGTAVVVPAAKSLHAFCTIENTSSWADGWLPDASKSILVLGQVVAFPPCHSGSLSGHCWLCHRSLQYGPGDLGSLKRLRSHRVWLPQKHEKPSHLEVTLGLFLVMRIRHQGHLTGRKGEMFGSGSGHFSPHLGSIWDFWSLNLSKILIHMPHACATFNWSPCHLEVLWMSWP